MNLRNIISPEENVMAGFDLNVYKLIKKQFHRNNISAFNVAHLQAGANNPDLINHRPTIEAFLHEKISHYNESIFKKRE